jgi:transketolase
MKEDCPNQFFNMGVAEANTIGVAAGLAMSGLLPIAYTITPFITIRCLEQIRDDICYHNVPVTVVGTGSGLSYASLGATHHSLDDIAALRPFPNMRIFAPADAHEVHAVLRAVAADPGPAYIRIGKRGEPTVHNEPPRIQIGEPLVLGSGSQVAILSVGNMAPVALEAAAVLESEGASTAVFSMHTVKPLNEAFLRRVFAEYDCVLSVEEHGRIGGFGAAVAEWLNDEDVDARIVRIAAADKFMKTVGDQDAGRRFYGLTADAICDAVRRRL